MDYEIANPEPAGTVASLSSLGYSVEAAVADLVDNSISADARRIEVRFTWAGTESWAAVVDDGHGMDDQALVTAMTIAGRGPAETRAANDLGRFGMGLKTALFSQCRQLTVRTRPDVASCFTRTWDLDAVIQHREWRLLRGTDPETEAVLARLLPAGMRGTVVLWRQLHRFNSQVVDPGTVAQTHFYGEVDRVQRHLGMVFGRLLTGRGGVELTVNGDVVLPWDPFLSTHPAVQRLQAEEIPHGGLLVRVEPFVLPSPHKLTDVAAVDAAAGPKGWLDQQGFYVFRRNRLILAGDWLRIRDFRRDERYNLARIAVDIPAEADADWRIDIRKSSAVPPVGIRRHLVRIGHATRTRASQTLHHRGQIAARTHGADFIYAWTADRRSGRIVCRVNRKHPLARKVLHDSMTSRADVAALIRLLEETVPVAALRTIHIADTADDPEPFAEATTQEMEHVAERIFHALVDDGQTPREARRRIALMSPFNEFDGFWQRD